MPENAAEPSGAVQMHVISESSSTEESESKPEAILVFADAIQRQPNDHEKSSFSQAINDPKSDTRGAAALQIFLLTYITPVEVCLNMLTCYRLDQLYPPCPPGPSYKSYAAWLIVSLQIS